MYYYLYYNTKPNQSQVKRRKKEDFMKKYLTCKEVAERYQVKVATVWDWVRSGILPAYKLGRIYRVDEDCLREFELRFHHEVSDSIRA